MVRAILRAFFGLIALLVIGVVALVVIGERSLQTDTGARSPSTPENVHAAPRPAVVDIPPVAPSAARAVETTSVQTITPPTGPPPPSASIQPSIQELSHAVITANERQAAAKSGVLDAFHGTADYQAARERIASLVSDLDSARSSGDQSQVNRIALELLNARTDITRMETKALLADPAFTDATGAVSSAQSKYKSAQSQIKVAADKEAAALAMKLAQEQYESDHDPINMAINGHYLIEEMSYSQSVETLGKPYSITNGNGVRSATWEYGPNNFWSATFVDDKIEVVSHTRL